MPKRPAANTAVDAIEELDNSSTGPVAAWNYFWFAPRDRIALDMVRVLLGFYLFVWASSCIGHQRAFFALNGWFDAEAYRRASLMPEDSHPPIGWSPAFMAGSGVGIDALFFGSLAVIALFTAGIAVRLTSVLTWLAVVGFTTNPVLFYGGDAFLLIGTLYVAVGYLSMGWRGKEEIFAPPFGSAALDRASVGANVGIRLLQVHLAIVVFTSALHKLQIGEWWAGDPFWFAWTDPARFSFRDLVALRESGNARALMVTLSLAAYVTLAWQLSFPFLMWRRAWTKFMLAGALVGALGGWWLYRLPVYGAGLFLGCLSFVEPRVWRALLARVKSRHRLLDSAVEEARDVDAQQLAAVNSR